LNNIAIKPSIIILALYSINHRQGLLTTSTIYRNDDFNSYAYSRLSDSPSKLLEHYIQQSLAKRQYVLAIIPSSSRAHHDLLLEVTFIDFSYDLVTKGPSSTVAVSIIFYLINPNDKRLLEAKQFRKKVIFEKKAQGATQAIIQASKIVARDVADMASTKSFMRS